MVFRRHLKKKPELQMAPMIDVVFQLLIFFLVASEVRPTEADFKANLPAGSGPRDAKVEKKEVYRVYLKNLDTEGNVVEVRLNDKKLQDADPFRELESRLNGIPQGARKNMLLVIDGDPTVKLKFIAMALDAAMAAGVPQITFGKPQTS
jgi:biopolymer transport protein ExbD